MQTSTAGFYGKVPCKGDFVGRGFSQQMTAQLDQWLQRGMVYSKQALAEQWSDRYMVAPIWRFYLAANTLDAQCWIGAMIPSVDRVGRCFPLLLAVPVTQAIANLQAFDQLTQTFIKLEDMLLESLEYDFDFDGFCHNVAQLTVIENHNTTAMLSFTPLQAQADNNQSSEQQDTSSLCIWQSEGSDDIPSQLFLSAQLPEQQQFLSYFTGVNNTEEENA